MNTIKVMAVDDEESFLSLLKLNLEQSGKFKVFAISDSSRAIREAKLVKPDVIILDINMPDIDGPAVCSKLAEDRDTKGIPIIFLTALITEEEEGEYKKRMDGKNYSYIAKPVDTDKLISIIEDVTGK
ncbi:MAG: response regulator [Candidatus Omnitrophota bacterium]